MKSTFYLLLAIVLISLESNAQARTRYQEYGISIGTLNSSGDIATTNNTAALLDEMGPNFTVFGQYHFNDWFTMGLQTSYGWMNMRDENHSNPTRGISNSTRLVQVNPYVQMHLIRFGKYRYARKFTTYVKFGAGFIAFDTDPQAQRVFGENTTEYPNAYSGINLFYGLGIKVRATKTSTISLETLFHNSGTDRFDGIGVNSAQSFNDYYGGIALKYGFMIF